MKVGRREGSCNGDNSISLSLSRGPRRKGEQMRAKCRFHATMHHFPSYVPLFPLTLACIKRIGTPTRQALLSSSACCVGWSPPIQAWYSGLSGVPFFFRFQAPPQCRKRGIRIASAHPRDSQVGMRFSNIVASLPGGDRNQSTAAAEPSQSATGRLSLLTPS